MRRATYPDEGNVMKFANKFAVWPLLAGSMMVASSMLSPSYAASSMESEYIDKNCQDPKTAICGAIIVGNAGSFTLDWVSVKARDTQPNALSIHPNCPGTSKKFDRNVPGANYNKYVVPASCAYKVTVKILSGNKKDQNLYLTPGCKIVVKVKGDLNSNKITVEASAISDQTPVNANKVPVDPQGYKCGKQGKAGF